MLRCRGETCNYIVVVTGSSMVSLKCALKPQLLFIDIIRIIINGDVSSCNYRKNKVQKLDAKQYMVSVRTARLDQNIF